MSQDHKKRVEQAVLKFHAKHKKETDKLNGLIKKRKHTKPEKDVEKECVTWMRTHGWVVQIYESKATLSNGVWRQQSMKAGNADCQGTLPGGIACYIEFKSPGRLSTFNNPKNQRQIDFILARIDMGAFACVVDSVTLLSHIYSEWKKLRETDPTEAKNYLLESLP
jgi:hypothetical protein